MKNTLTKISFLLMAIVIIIAMCPIQAKADTQPEKIIYKDNSNNYLIYYKDYLNTAFRFIITKNEEKPEITLAKSSIESGEENLNVAYVYEGAPLENEKGYMWIIDENDEFVVTADPVDLSDSIDDEIIQKITKNLIEIDANKSYEATKIENDVTKNVTLGKVEIKDKDVSYEYQLLKVEDESKEQEIFDLAEQLETEATGTYEKLALNKQFYDLYEELKPTSGWNAVENAEILQPDSAKKGDKYLVWIRPLGSTNAEEVNFFVSDYSYTPEYKNDDKVIKEVVKVPVTYDSIVLIGIFVAIVVAIIIVAILRKNAKRQNH